MMLRIGDEHVSLVVKNVAGARGVSAKRKLVSLLSRRAFTSVTGVSICVRGLIGGLHLTQSGRLHGTGLRVRPPPSLLRGLQAPSDSLSPSDGAANFQN
jgi:hypothetical protein